jgi:hypothetical protein
MYLKRRPSEVSSDRRHAPNFFAARPTARKDSAVHVSLSSYSLVKQRGEKTECPVLPGEAGKPSKPNAPENRRVLFHCTSEELQRRVITPLADGAPMGRI